MLSKRNSFFFLFQDTLSNEFYIKSLTKNLLRRKNIQKHVSLSTKVDNPFVILTKEKC